MTWLQSPAAVGMSDLSYIRLTKQGVCGAERLPGGIKLARTPMAASRLSLEGSPLHPSSPMLEPTALPITFQVSRPFLHWCPVGKQHANKAICMT